MADGAQQQQAPDSEPRPLACENFQGVNTATTRAGVPDQQAYWIDGFIPLAPRNLRTLYGLAIPIYSAHGPTVVCFYFYNIGPTPYFIVFLSDGSAVQVNVTTGSIITVLPVATILNPSITNLGISQYGSQYLLIVANQTNGYWAWDGTTLYTAGTLAPGVTLTNVGSGYFSPPTVTITGGHGMGATFSATIANGVVTGVTITNAGTGYLAGDSPTLIFSGGNTAGSGASLTAVMSFKAGGTGAVLQANFVPSGVTTYSQQLSSITIVGSGATPYTGLATATINAPPTGSGWYKNAPPSLSLTIGATGAIAAVTIVPNSNNPNNLYDPGSGFPSGVTVTDPGAYYVSSVTIVSGGTDYGPSCTITASGGAVFTQAVIQPVITGGVITGTNIIFGGYYSTSGPPTLTVNDTATNAAGTVNLMTSGIQGNAIETYQGRVWIVKGNVLIVGAPGSIWDFSTSDGGLQQTDNDSFQRVAYTSLVQTNGFLFLISDSSMNYISGVTTTTTNNVTSTTFSNQNCDPEVGTPYPAAVTTLGTEILIANPTGIFVSSGGEFQKRSETMDGVYNTVPSSNFNANPFNGFELSAAKATIFDKRVWMVLVPIVDPVSAATVNKLLMFRDDGKIWWASQQDVALTFITAQEINSVYTAWGTDGTSIYQLFAQPSTAFTKTLQSKYWDMPGGYDHNKAVTRFWSMWNYYSMLSPNITLELDSVGIDGNGLQYTNSQTVPITGPTATGYFVTLPQAVGQQGVLNGFTLQTNAADAALISAEIQPEAPVQYRG